MVDFVVTSPLSLARVLWWYGEDDWWPSALELSPATVADLAPRFAELLAAPAVVEDLWPGAPLLDAHLVLAAIEHFEGRPRAAVRRHRRGAALPERLDLSEKERWEDPGLAEVLRLVDERTGTPGPRAPGSLPGRLHGRWASA